MFDVSKISNDIKKMGGAFPKKTLKEFLTAGSNFFDEKGVVFEAGAPTLQEFLEKFKHHASETLEEFKGYLENTENLLKLCKTVEDTLSKFEQESVEEADKPPLTEFEKNFQTNNET